MTVLLYSLVCAILCVHALVDINCADSRASHVRRIVLVTIAVAAFAGIFRPAMTDEHGALVSTVLLAALGADCMIRHYRRHWYADRRDADLVARMLDRL